MILRDEFIIEALFTISAESAMQDFNSNEHARLQMYKIYETSVKYITKFARLPLLQKNEEAVDNPDLDEGWYFMPNDFVSWMGRVSPALEYKVDSNYQYSVRLRDKHIRYYAFYEDLTGLDVYFKQALKWYFLSELKISDSSIENYVQLIQAEKIDNMQRLRTEAKSYNILSGGR